MTLYPVSRSLPFLVSLFRYGCLIKARSLMLLTILLDDHRDEEIPYTKIWNMFHDFYIDKDCMDMISVQFEKLIKFSVDMNTWTNSPYANILKIINTETLHLLHIIWNQYAKMASTDPSVDSHFRLSVKNLFTKYYGDEKPWVSPLTWSFGIFGAHTQAIARHHMTQFWKTGVADIQNIPERVYCNPLFIYSASAKDKFAVNHLSNPLTAYHLSTAFSNLTPDSSSQAQMNYDNPATLKSNTSKVVESAKTQFKDWCETFRCFVKDCSNGKLVIRFIAADPFAFCFALQKRNPEGHVELPTNYSTTWSGVPLELDAPGAKGIPMSFNVIDTADVVNHQGCIELFVSIVPLMEVSPVSTIQMETTIPWTEEIDLLRQLLSDVVLPMCHIFDVAPIAFLTGVSTRGLLQDLPAVLDFRPKKASFDLQSRGMEDPGLGRLVHETEAH